MPFFVVKNTRTPLELPNGSLVFPNAFSIYPRKETACPQERAFRIDILSARVLNFFPSFECSFDCQKILMFGVIGVLFNRSASPSKPPTACRAIGIFRKTFGQRILELSIKR
jgi:hypothetical protein